MMLSTDQAPSESPTIPTEVAEQIISYLYDDPNTLICISTVCSSWLALSRRLLFNPYTEKGRQLGGLQTIKDVETFASLFTSPHSSLPSYLLYLQIPDPSREVEDADLVLIRARLCKFFEHFTTTPIQTILMWSCIWNSHLTESFRTGFPYLTDLIISGERFIDASELIPLISALSTLKRLNLSMDWLNLRPDQNLPAPSFRLRSLHLQGTIFHSWRVIVLQWLLAHPTSLKDLKELDVRMVQDVYVPVIAKCLSLVHQTLQSLEFSMLRDVPEILQLASLQLPRRLTLHVGSGRMSNALLFSFIEQTQGIEEIAVALGIDVPYNASSFLEGWKRAIGLPQLFQLRLLEFRTRAPVLVREWRREIDNIIVSRGHVHVEVVVDGDTYF